MSNATSISDDNFEEVVMNGTVPVVVDFWAEWCGPCKAIAPALDEIAAELDGQVKIVKMNIDENQSTPMKYGVRAIPTLMMFKNGELVSTQTGGMAKGALSDWIKAGI